MRTDTFKEKILSKRTTIIFMVAIAISVAFTKIYVVNQNLYRMVNVPIEVNYDTEYDTNLNFTSTVLHIIGTDINNQKVDKYLLYKNSKKTVPLLLGSYSIEIACPNLSSTGLLYKSNDTHSLKINLDNYKDIEKGAPAIEFSFNEIEPTDVTKADLQKIKADYTKANMDEDYLTHYCELATNLQTNAKLNQIKHAEFLKNNKDLIVNSESFSFTLPRYWKNKVNCENIKGPDGEECVAIYSKKYPNIEIACVYVNDKPITPKPELLDGTPAVIELDDNKTACFKVNNFMWMLTYSNNLDKSFSLNEKTTYEDLYTNDEWEELIKLQTLGCKTVSSCQNLPKSYDDNYLKPSVSYCKVTADKLANNFEYHN